MFPKSRPLPLILLVAGGLISPSQMRGQDVQHLSVTQPGGMPGLPVMTGIERTTNGVRISWDGPSGYYQVVQRTDLAGSQWQPIGGRTNLSRTATISTLYSNAFFRVSGPSPRYVGAQACSECHGKIHDSEMDTRHAHALETLKAAHSDTNPDCLACHTVGFGLPTGFINEAKTPQLAGVQCENCHGPAANHAANPDDPTVRPRIELAGQVCGGCHTDSHHPTFNEWKSSGHFAVVEDMNPPDRVSNCGRCHSGSARLALIKGLNPAVAVTNDANVGITCVVCHDPHQKHVWTNAVTGLVYTNQLRQSLSSTNDFFLSTSDTFTNKYDPNINVCAQCHNHRGASWTSTSRPPHHSPQYNMLLGTVGVLPTGVTSGAAAHGGTGFLTDDSGGLHLVTNQCVTCHMQKQDYQHGPPEVAAVTGHEFAMNSYSACADCHGTGANAEALTDLIQPYVSGQIQQVKAELDSWARTKAPSELYAKYGTRAWEYRHRETCRREVQGQAQPSRQ